MQRDPYSHSEWKSPTRLDDAGCEFLQLGMSCTTGAEVPVDLVSGHKWFNLAAMLGNKDAIRLRREIAAEMTTAEVTLAQRAARDWITRH
jgi:uncharacterized protein